MDFTQVKNIAIVGLSDDPKKASYRVADYLQQKGFKIIPVNPTIETVLGEKSYSDVASIPESIQVDVVDFFRKPEAVKPYVEQAVSRGGIKGIWMQEGVVNEEAATLAREHGMEVVMDKCMMKKHKKFLGIEDTEEKKEEL
ncbi:MAG: CoA-binding protein [Thermincola sp.]|jgi:predicted CoA-binding protein|nr:CoA-binding protein [Thermincola sp.]MDT3703725.1 CoA-binding protein [Thermincola sp.]